MLGHYGEAIVRLREAKGLKRATLARHCGITAREMSDLEKSASQPPRRVLDALCAGLGITRDEFAASAGFLPAWAEEAFRADPHAVLEAIRDCTPATVSARKEPQKLGKPVLRTKQGELYQSDCVDLLATIRDDEIDLVFADPPFNLDKDYGGQVDDALAEQNYVDWCQQWLAELARVLKPGGSLFFYNIPKWNLRLGAWLCQFLEFRHWIAVDIKFSLPIPGRLYPSHYSLLYFTKGTKPKRFLPPRLPIDTCRHCGGELRDYGGYKDRMNPAGVNVTDVWTDLSPVRHSRFKRRKANELPLKMLDRVLDIASDEGDLVLDPFGGSGTTYVAAELKNRRWLGCEIGDCDPIIERFEMLDSERHLLEEIREKVNVLFTEDSLTLRAKFGHDTSRYQIPSGGNGKRSGDSQSRLFD